MPQLPVSMQGDAAVCLLPRPQGMAVRSAPFPAPPRLAADYSNSGPLLHEAETAVAIFGAAGEVAIDPDAAYIIRCEYDAAHQDEAYGLNIGETCSVILASTGSGIHRALSTMAQLIIGGQLAQMDIEDRPLLARRGYMLDISRDRVPARRTLLHILNALWLCKYNELQLYVEHTFAFAGHEEVWRDASPLRADDIRWLEDQCAARGMELVPNLNSLGHFGRWLKHPRYGHLSECPDGITLPNGRVMPPGGTTLAPGGEALAFLDSLYAQYLPLFASGIFNAGLDEPWELGLGRSRAECEARSRHSVYLDHLRAVASLADKYGKKLQFWADIVLEAPERVPELPPEATGMIWGYEAGHPFAEHCAAFARAGLPFVVCPGTTGWNSIAGRWQNARANIAEAVRSAVAEKGRGVLLTDWGDNGHHQALPVSLPPLLHCAQLAWNGNEVPDVDIAAALDRIVLRDEAGVCGEALLSLGSLGERHFALRLHNCSPLWRLLFSPAAEQPSLLPPGDAANIPAARSELEGLLAAIARAEPKGMGGALVRSELELTAELLLLALDRGVGMVEAGRHKALCDSFEELWLMRSERGGLKDSLSRLGRSALES